MSDETSGSIITPLAGVARDARARLLARGLVRHLCQLGLTAIPEVVLPNGRRADLAALGRSGEIWIIEIKSSVEDFRTDTKWRDYLPFCDRFFFASHVDVPPEIYPEEAGFILCDGFGAEIIRQNQRSPLAGPTRKALTIDLARLASLRLMMLGDPEARFPAEF
jgi:hypothetical protein